MEASALIMIGACLALVDEISKSITLEQKQQVNNIKDRELALTAAECKELHGTITCTKTTLSSLSSLSSITSSSCSSLTPPPSPPQSRSSPCCSTPLTTECNVQSCITGIQSNLAALHRVITQQDTNNRNKFKVFNAKRLKMFQLDFALKQKADQIAGLYLNDKVNSLITDSSGKEFWDKCFGQALFVTWTAFLRQFETYLNMTVKQTDLLKKTMDFTDDDFVSLYEFSLFLKWFGPFDGCYTRFQEAFDTGVLCGFVPGMEANMLLDGKPAGYYLVRFSKTQPGSLAVTFVDDSTATKHCLLHSASPSGLTLKSPPTIYKSILDFVAAHKNKLKYPITHQERATMNQNSYSRAFIQTEHEYDISPAPATNTKSTSSSSSILPPTTTSINGNINGTTTSNQETTKGGAEERNLCVVCLDNHTNTVFLECSHMACCSVCAKSLPVCPVCRSKISRIVHIYRP